MNTFDINNLKVSQTQRVNNTRPVVLTIAGSDSSGCAGIAMDIKCQSTFGVHTAMVITANTAQTNQGVQSVNATDAQVFSAQLESATAQNISAIKIGLINSAEQIQCLLDYFRQGKFNDIPVIIDPVIQSSSGTVFFDEDTLAFYKKSLLPYCTLLTPNLHELKTLTGQALNSFSDIENAAQQLKTMGAKAVLVKGGHSRDFSLPSDWVQDYFTDAKASFWLANKTVKTQATRGTGCALASSIAASIALGYSDYDAVVLGKMAINQGLRESYCIDSDQKHYGPVDINCFPMSQQDLPSLSLTPLLGDEFNFPNCNETPLGLYPVVDRAKWIERLAPSGITTIQLRVKDLTGDKLKQEIRAAITLTEQYSIRLFINDYWQLAIECGAYGVHLGQEDLDGADISAIQQAGLRLGISTHCHYEVARAHRYRPSYIACGPVFHTNTKDMPWVPHGLKGLHYWREVLHYPLVAIGGINDQRFDSVAALEVDSIAMITAITLADDPVATAHNFSERLLKAQQGLP